MVRTIVTREPEWDDQQRTNMLALAEYEADLCACGLPKHVADADPSLEVKYRVCPVCAGLAKTARIQQSIDETATRALGEKPAPEADRPTDGRHFAGFRPVGSGGSTVDREDDSSGDQ